MIIFSWRNVFDVSGLMSGHVYRVDTFGKDLIQKPNKALDSPIGPFNTYNQVEA